MTKIPRISGNAMIRYLIRKEFTTTSRKGSHVTLRRDHVPVTVPAGNGKLKVGLLLGVLDKAGIDRKEFVDDHIVRGHLPLPIRHELASMTMIFTPILTIIENFA